MTETVIERIDRINEELAELQSVKGIENYAAEEMISEARNHLMAARTDTKHGIDRGEVPENEIDFEA